MGILAIGASHEDSLLLPDCCYIDVMLNAEKSQTWVVIEPPSAILGTLTIGASLYLRNHTDFRVSSHAKQTVF